MISYNHKSTHSVLAILHELIQLKLL